MDMRTYRVMGIATYLDKAGDVKRININLTTNAPDASTAATLMLAEIEIRKGANADYDPQARWEVGCPPTVEDETAKQEAVDATGLSIGANVLHKSGGSAKRGADARRGIVRRIYTIYKNNKLVVKASVDWPALRRINGDGWHRSDVLASALILATDDEADRRRAINRAFFARSQERWQHEKDLQ